MNDVEKNFLLAVERGDIGLLKELLNTSKTRFDINCCDPLARNALIIAIDNENLDIVKLLIEAGIHLGDALLYAIDENFVEAVELLLDHDEANSRSGRQHSWEQEHENSSFSADLTPLILAAHRNNFEIIRILLDRRVSPIPDPHDPRCDCSKCSTARSEDCLKHSRARINAYKALASPCLMALSRPDPLLTAFELSAKLERLANMEPEYKQDYLKLRTQCQTFATKLLDHTRTSKELEILLNYSDEYSTSSDQLEAVGDFGCLGSLYDTNNQRPPTRMDKHLNSWPLKSELSDSGRGRLFGRYSMYKVNKERFSLDSVTGKAECYRSDMRLARLRLAIDCKQKAFCAHPNIQELLATMWYEHLPGFRRKNAFAQLFQVLLIGIMFPVYSMAYLIAPHSQLGRYIKKPFIKFICHSASYITFLIVLTLASQRVEAFYNWSSVLSLFSKESSSRTAQSSNNQSNIVAAFYRQLNGPGATSAARGLDSLSKIFDQLPASSKKRGTLPSPIEMVILVWVLSLIWAEIKQLRALGINYYKSDMWNTLDSVASAFYVSTIILRIVSYMQSDEQSTEVAREHWQAYDPTLLSEGLFAAATIFSALKLVYIFSLNPYLGPLQISLGRMAIDILRFSWIYMLVLFSFACGMNQLLWYYADLEKHQCLNITNYSLAQYYMTQQERQANMAKSDSMDMNEGRLNKRATPSTMPSILSGGNSKDDMLLDDVFPPEGGTKPPVTLDDSCKTYRHFSNVFESSQTLFWATFGLVDLENFDLTGIRQYTRFWALLMFGCYCFINVIVVLNLLIAMMNHSYEKISKKSDIEWKFARTRLWMSYFDTGSTVPAPFNIIPSIKSIVYLSRSTLSLMYQALSFIPKKFPSVMRRTRTGECGIGTEMRSTICSRTARDNSQHLRDRHQRNCSLTASYRNVMRSLVRRYLVSEQRILERKSKLTEAKLNRWAKSRNTLKI